MNDTKQFLSENPKYIEICEHLIEYECDNPTDSIHVEDTPYDSCWDYTDVKVKPQALHQLEMNGILERVFDSNSQTVYVLYDREELQEILSKLNVGSDGMMTELHNFPTDDELPDDLFDDVVGYENIKWLIRRGLTTNEITNFLLVGPTGSAKTVFLMAINEKLNNSEFVSGSPTSGPGVLDVMFTNTPQYMLIDEIDDMDAGTQRVLTQYTETGIVDETKVGKNRKLKTNTKTIASANTTDSIIEQIEDRFLDLHFEPYTREEYIEVCKHILPRKEDVTEDEGRIIAEELWQATETGDVRKAIQVARLSRGDPKKVIEVLGDYSDSKEVIF